MPLENCLSLKSKYVFHSEQCRIWTELRCSGGSLNFWAESGSSYGKPETNFLVKDCAMLTQILKIAESMLLYMI